MGVGGTCESPGWLLSESGWLRGSSWFSDGLLGIPMHTTFKIHSNPNQIRCEASNYIHSKVSLLLVTDFVTDFDTDFDTDFRYG